MVSDWEFCSSSWDEILVGLEEFRTWSLIDSLEVGSCDERGAVVHQAKVRGVVVDVKSRSLKFHRTHLARPQEHSSL